MELSSKLEKVYALLTLLLLQWLSSVIDSILPGKDIGLRSYAWTVLYVPLNLAGQWDNFYLNCFSDITDSEDIKPAENVSRSITCVIRSCLLLRYHGNEISLTPRVEYQRGGHAVTEIVMSRMYLVPHTYTQYLSKPRSHVSGGHEANSPIVNLASRLDH